MAARKVRKDLDADWRSKIQASQLLNRLRSNALSETGEIMTSGQIKSAEILLRKVLPDLKAIEYQDEDGNPVTPHVIVSFK